MTYHNSNKIRRILPLLLSLLLILTMTGGCGKRSAKTEDPSLSETLIADVVEIPENGMITANQFNAFAGTSRTISFIGSSDNINYTWDYNGRNIHNAMDMDLSIDFITDEATLAPMKEAANNAPYALGMVLKGTGTITVPTLTIVYPEAWDADTAVFCKQLDGAMYRMADAEITVDEEANTTTLSMKILEVGDTYYIVAGSSTGQPKTDPEESEESAPEASGEETVDESADQGQTPEKDADKDQSISQGQESTQKPKETTKAPTPAPEPTKAETTKAETKPAPKTLKCTICITCKTILDNMDQLEADKAEFVPEDGWILLPTTVEFNDGDTVMDVLIAVCRAYKIPIEHNGSYVEGINQLYEFDCGELSGWMYSVDGWFPNYGANSYVLSDGETIRWSYTCDLGKDVGDNSKW